MFNVIISVLFAATPVCQSDTQTNCHRPARDAAHSVIYISPSNLAGGDDEIVLTGREF